MRVIWIVPVLLVGCARPPEAQVVAEVRQELGVFYQLDVDTLRFKRADAKGPARFAEFIDSHLLTVGPLRDGPEIPGVLVRRVQLPSPGYLLRARIRPRADDFCHLMIDIVSMPGEQQVERAPFAALQALEAVYQGVTSFLPPRLGPLDPLRFARLTAQAAQLGSQGKDPPLTPIEYKRVPRPVQLVPQDDYWVPPSDVSTVAPAR